MTSKNDLKVSIWQWKLGYNLKLLWSKVSINPRLYMPRIKLSKFLKMPLNVGLR